MSGSGRESLPDGRAGSIDPSRGPGGVERPSEVREGSGGPPGVVGGVKKPF